MFLTGAVVGLVVWIAVVLSFLWSYLNYWMEDKEGDYKPPLIGRAFLNLFTYDGKDASVFNMVVFWGALFAPFSFGVLAILVQFLLFNIVIPLVVVALVGMAFLGRAGKRMKKVFTKHVGDKSIHNGSNK